jgi:hypothetical protein
MKVVICQKKEKNVSNINEGITFHTKQAERAGTSCKGGYHGSGLSMDLLG